MSQTSSLFALLFYGAAYNILFLLKVYLQIEIFARIFFLSHQHIDMCMKFIYWIIFCVFRFTAGVYHITHDCTTTIIVPPLNRDSVRWGR